MTAGDEFRQELFELTKQTAEQLRWQRECGAAGLPVGGAVAGGAVADGKATDQGPVQQTAVAEPAALVQSLGHGETVGTTQRASAPAASLRAGDANGRRAAADPAAAGSALADLSPAQAIAELEGLAEQVQRCTLCPLHEHRTQTVFGRGNPHAELVFVGEGPGMDEDAQGIPFVGAAGQLLDKMIAAMGYGRDEVYICNIVKCRPPKNRKPEPDEMTACLPYLRRQLELVRPKALVALGATGTEGLLGWRYRDGRGIGITRIRGKWKLYEGRIPVMPTFHPSYLLRSPQKKRDVWNDLKQVMKQLGKPVPTPSGRQVKGR